MRGVGIVFSRFLEVDINTGVIVGMVIVFIYAVLGGMKGITYTQVAQYCVLIFAYMVPAIFISILITGNPIPQLGFGSKILNEDIYLLDKLNLVLNDLGFNNYTESVRSKIDVFCITGALMAGTAGLPHVIVRFFTVPRVRDARTSAGWALLFIAILYTTAPAVSSFSRLNFIDTIHNSEYKTTPQWFKNWENIGLISWSDKNNDGIIQYGPGNALENTKPIFSNNRGVNGERVVINNLSKNKNEIYIDRDIMVLANPEIAALPNWVIALVAAGALAAALSTAAGLLLVISSAISHDLLKKIFRPSINDKQELFFARLSAAVAIAIAGVFGIYPPAFVAQVVAFAFGLAASSIFPALIMGIFSKRINSVGAIVGMISGLIFTLSYIIFFKFISPELNTSDYWLFGISPEGIGVIGMLVNFFLAITISSATKPPPEKIKTLVNKIREPG
jgi:cation/acetate symporter